MSTKIFVGSLPSGTKPEELRHLFESHGVVTECDVMNRCGFVHMEKPEMAAKAIKALNSTKFKGETLNVEPGRIRDRNQKPGGIGAARSGNNRQRGGRNQIMQNFNDAGMMGPIDERTTKDALQLCSAVLEEINKLVNTDQIGATRRGGFPQNFVENQIGAVLGGMNRPKGQNNRGPRNRNNGPPKQAALPAPAPLQAPANRGAVKNNANQAQRGPAPNQGNMNRGAKQAPNQSGPQGRGPNQGNAGRMQNQGNQGFSGRNQNSGNVGRVPKQGNVGPIRNEPSRQQQRATAAPYNRGPVNNEVNFADDVPIVNSARNFANSLASGSSQIDRWQSNNGNFGNEDMNRHPMNRNFDEDMPMNNFNADAPIVINMVTRPSGSSGMGGNDRRGAMNNQSLSNQGNFGHGGPVDDPFQASNDRFQGGNDRFMGRNNDRFQGNNNNDRFQGGNSSGNFGNQDRRGFALPEKQMFNDSPSFGNSDLRSGGMSQFGGQNNQGNMGGGNRNVGFGNNTNNNAGRQQSAPESRNMGMGGGGMNSSSGNAMFTRRNNNNMGNMDGNNMGNSRMRNDVQDSNRGGNFGGNNNRTMGNTGGGGMNSNNAGFNRNNNMGGNTANLHGPISANNRNMGGGNANMNRNSGNGMGNNNNRNMQGGNNGMGNNVNRNMGGNNSGNNMNRNNNMGGNSKQINPLNFQKDFPALQSGGQNMNMNNRNGPRQNMMSNRRY